MRVPRSTHPVPKVDPGKQRVKAAKTADPRARHTPPFKQRTHLISRFTLMAVIGLSLLVVAGPAQADSIVFVRGGDIWLTTPDGSREHRVTTGQKFTAVTQADDGTIFGAYERGVLVKYDRNGKELQRPVGGIDKLNLDVTPDGRQISFWYLLSSGGFIDALNSDGSQGNWDEDNGEHANWIDNNIFISTNGAGYIMVTRQGNGGTHYRGRVIQGSPVAIAEASSVRERTPSLR